MVHHNFSLQCERYISLSNSVDLNAAVIKFFGHLAQAEPDKTLQQYPQFLENVFSLISSDDPTLVPVAVETLGVLSQSDVGVRFVFNHPARNKHVMKVLYNHATSTLGSVVQLRALDALALIFQSEEQPSGDLSALVKSLYDTLGPEPLQMLMSIAKQPFEESRCAALRVMTSLARYRWAQQNMISSPGELFANRIVCVPFIFYRSHQEVA